MLNAKARSKAKLPVCAMRENLELFFQKVVEEATARAGKGRHSRTTGKRVNAPPNNVRRAYVKRLTRIRGNVSATGRRPGLGRQAVSRVAVTRCVDGNAGELRVRQRTNRRLRGPAQIRGVPPTG